MFLQWEGPGVVVVMYDVTNKESFSSCAKWLNRVEAQKYSPDNHFPGEAQLAHATRKLAVIACMLFGRSTCGQQNRP